MDQVDNLLTSSNLAAAAPTPTTTIVKVAIETTSSKMRMPSYLPSNATPKLTRFTNSCNTTVAQITIERV